MDVRAASPACPTEMVGRICELPNGSTGTEMTEHSYPPYIGTDQSWEIGRRPVLDQLNGSLMGTCEHRPVILPLPGVEGSRCSVKPASRSFLLSRIQETQSLRPSPMVQPSAWNGQAN
jgi:hypothetical protein